MGHIQNFYGDNKVPHKYNAIRNELLSDPDISNVSQHSQCCWRCFKWLGDNPSQEGIFAR